MKQAIILFLFIIQIQTFAQPKITDLRTENLVAPLGLGAKQPRLSWKIISDKRDFMQTAYEIQISTTKNPSKGDAWNTGKIISDQSTSITYKGQELKSTEHYFWR